MTRRASSRFGVVLTSDGASLAAMASIRAHTSFPVGTESGRVAHRAAARAMRPCIANRCSSCARVSSRRRVMMPRTNGQGLLRWRLRRKTSSTR